MKAGFISLGCAKNLVDTEVMLGILQDNGIELTPDPAEAEIIIVNTCAFIQSAKEESITTVLNMAEYKETGCCRSLIIAGCLGERYHQELLDDMPEADAIIGTGAWNRIMEAVRETLAGNRIVLAGENEIVYDAKTPRILTTPVYTAYVKIAEGCDHRCAFCAIPLIRGRHQARGHTPCRRGRPGNYTRRAGFDVLRQGHLRRAVLGASLAGACENREGRVAACALLLSEEFH